MSDILQIMVAAISNASIYALLALSLVLVFRGSTVVNFGVGYLAVFAGIIFANSTITGWFGLLLTLVAGAALGLSMYTGSVLIGERLGAEHTPLAISTLGFGLILNYFAGEFWPKQNFTVAPLWSGSMQVAGVTISYQRILTVILTMVCFALVLLLLERTTVGWALEAVAFKRTAAAAYGVNVLVAMLVVWALAGAVAGLAGALLAPLSSIGRPLSLHLAVLGFSSAVIGGLGSVNGAVLGALVVATTEALFIRYVSTTYASAFSFLLLFLVLAVRPQGILGQSRLVTRA